MLETYSPTAFSSLNASTARAACEAGFNAIPALGSVIIDHGLESEIGINFLHKHFDLRDDERLVEIMEGSRTVTRPMLATDASDLIPYLWRAMRDQTTGEMHWYPLEYVSRSSLSAAALAQAERVAANPAFLEELAVRLEDHQLLDVFGISTLHREAIVPSDEFILSETTNIPARTLTLSVVPKASLDLSRDMETVWSFSRNAKGDVDARCANTCVFVGSHH